MINVQDWEPVTDEDHYMVCEHALACRRAVDLMRCEGPEVLRCSKCQHFEDNGEMP